MEKYYAKKVVIYAAMFVILGVALWATMNSAQYLLQKGVAVTTPTLDEVSEDALPTDLSGFVYFMAESAAFTPEQGLTLDVFALDVRTGEITQVSDLGTIGSAQVIDDTTALFSYSEPLPDNQQAMAVATYDFTTGSINELTQWYEQTALHHLDVSPDQAHFAVTKRAMDDINSSVVVYSIDGTVRTEIPNAAHPKWVDANQLAYMSSEGIAVTNIMNNTSRIVVEGDGYQVGYRDFTVAPGEDVLYITDRSQPNLQKLTLSLEDANNDWVNSFVRQGLYEPTLSPDGKYLAGIRALTPASDTTVVSANMAIYDAATGSLITLYPVPVSTVTFGAITDWSDMLNGEYNN